MSHLISGVELEAMPVFSHTPAQIVKPRFKQYMRAGGNTMENFGNHNDKALMSHICDRYTKLEQENIKRERDLFVSEQCSSLKGKIKNILHPKSRYPSFEAGRSATSSRTAKALLRSDSVSTNSTSVK